MKKLVFVIAVFLFASCDKKASNDDTSLKVGIITEIKNQTNIQLQAIN